MTIIELFCTAIQKSYNELAEEGVIKIDIATHKKHNYLFNKIMDGVNVDSLFKAIMRIHIEKVKGTELFEILQEEDRVEENKQCKKEIITVIKQGVKTSVEIDQDKNYKI